MNKQELSDTLDKFIYGKIGDELRRDPTGCHLHVGGCWIPVEDWKKQRRYNLPEIAEYFYDLGKKDMKKRMMKDGIPGTITNINSCFNDIVFPSYEFRKATEPFRDGDKVKAIIVPED